MALSQEEDFDPRLFLKSFSKIDHLYLMEKYSKMMQYLPWFLSFQLEDFIVYYEGLRFLSLILEDSCDCSKCYVTSISSNGIGVDCSED